MAKGRRPFPLLNISAGETRMLHVHIGVIRVTRFFFHMPHSFFFFFNPLKNHSHNSLGR